MLVLFETAAGYAIFKLLDESKLEQSENIWKYFETPDKASKILKLKEFKRFKDTADALEACTSLAEGKIGKHLKKLLKKQVLTEIQEPLAVADAKLGSLIKEKFKINCLNNNAVSELMRCIRSQLDSLITELPEKEQIAMMLGTAHSLSRYKLKFSADKVDIMIIQAVSLLDDIDKELNNYIMRCREWYSWHFPELGKLIADHIAYAKAVNLIGIRENALTMDLSSVLPEDLAEQVKEAAVLSMGTEISEFDILNIRNLCDQILELSKYRDHLSDYLKNRMMALAPNATVLLGELVAARLIAHAGSLINLAKYPSSTVQILGAEKALFRALKTKKDTPKYGLIYHAQLIGQTPGKLKGKMSRMLAAKAALGCRVDALGENNEASLGIEHRAYLEKRIQELQSQGIRRISGTGKEKANFGRHAFKTDVETYDPKMDSTVVSKKRKLDTEDDSALPTGAVFRKVKQEHEAETEVAEAEPEAEIAETTTPKKKKKKLKAEAVEEPVQAEDDGTFHNGEAADGAGEEPPKKRKKKKST